MSSESSNSLDRQSGKNTGLVSLKMGLVEDRKVGWVIVRFPDLGDMLTKWIPVLYTKTQNDKGFWTPTERKNISSWCPHLPIANQSAVDRTPDCALFKTSMNPV
jgi:hypothetical protein